MSNTIIFQMMTAPVVPCCDFSFQLKTHSWHRGWLYHISHSSWLCWLARDFLTVSECSFHTRHGRFFVIFFYRCKFNPRCILISKRTIENLQQHFSISHYPNLSLVLICHFSHWLYGSIWIQLTLQIQSFQQESSGWYIVPFLYARLKNGRIMPWQCPSVRLSVRPSGFSGFSGLFFNMLWDINLKLGIYIQ